MLLSRTSRWSTQGQRQEIVSSRRRRKTTDQHHYCPKSANLEAAIQPAEISAGTKPCSRDDGTAVHVLVRKIPTRTHAHTQVRHVTARATAGRSLSIVPHATHTHTQTGSDLLPTQNRDGTFLLSTRNGISFDSPGSYLFLFLLSYVSSFTPGVRATIPLLRFFFPGR